MNIVLSSNNWCNGNYNSLHSVKKFNEKLDVWKPNWYTQRHHRVNAYFYIRYDSINLDIINTEDPILILGNCLQILCKKSKIYNDKPSWKTHKEHIYWDKNKWVINKCGEGIIYYNNSNNNLPPNKGWLSDKYSETINLYAESSELRQTIPDDIELTKIIEWINSGNTKLYNSFIFGSNFDEIITFLKEMFNVNSIYHVLPYHYIDYNLYYNCIIENNFNGLRIINDNLDNMEFIYYNNKYYQHNLSINLQNVTEDDFTKEAQIVPKQYGKRYNLVINKYNIPINKSNPPEESEIIQFGIKNKDLSPRPYKIFKDRSHTKVISIGGWCGPAECLRVMGIRNESLPFDYMHSSVRGINYILRGYIKYLSCPSMSVYPHHGIHSEGGVDDFTRRTERFLNYIRNEEKPILFIRAVINTNPYREIKELHEMMALLKSKYNRENDKILVILHDQYIGTLEIKKEGSIMITSAEGLIGWKVQNRIEYLCNYCKLLEYALDDNSWKNDEIYIKNYDYKSIDMQEINRNNISWRNNNSEYGDI